MRRHGGFSITELMVVVAIVAILLGIGAPSYRYITNSYRMSAEVNGLLGDLQYARAEAIREGQTVTACVSSDGASCTRGADWANGWIVFSAGGVLRVQGAFTGTTPDTFIADSNVTAVTYNREGFATTAAGFAGTTLTLHDSTANSAWSRCLVITAVGLMTTQTHVSNPGTCT
ncbi:MAG: prepilin-type N-terminal cleavage/methylation domain-containing protein [Gammaproteobacteria bacterium]|nr:MAG: prepilin-type N-terminal cleavage/methylation domain-containing protein [Gammaproteobacteria bacterium]